MQTLFADIRYALRQFRLSPVFTVSAILTLALGIGSTTAIFSLIDAVMLRSLPVADPGSLFRIGDGYDCCVEGGPQNNWGMYSFPIYERLKSAAPEFEQLAAFQSTPWTLSVRAASQHAIAKPLQGEYVTGNYFSTFGIRSFAGRLISPSDDQSSATPVAVLSYRAWQGMYGADPSVIGATYMISQHPFTIIGVAPPGFFGETLRSDPPDIWLPLQQEPLLNGSNSLVRQSVAAWLRIIGKLRPGATVDGMSARLTAVLRQWLRNDSGYPAVWMPEVIRQLPKQTIHVIPAGSGVQAMKDDYGRSLHILLAVCGLVLLIACANVANLLLARAMRRRSQTSLRLAIGASRGRIISQSLTESILLSVGGGLAGLFVADAAGRLLLRLAFHSARFVPIDTTPSLPVLAFALALSLFTGVLFGTAPAWFATHADPIEALRGANRSTADTSSFWRTSLLVLQATLSLVLVAGAGMLTRSLSNLEHQNLGFETKNRLSVVFNPLPSNYPPDRVDAIYRKLDDRLNHLPGVERAGLALYNPLTDNWGEAVFVQGHSTETKLNGEISSSLDRVSPDYLRTVGQPVLRGRSLTEADTNTAPPVAVVNEAFVRKFFPKEDPLDKHFGIDSPSNAGNIRIVGVVRDAKYTDPQQPVRAMFFLPLGQHIEYKDETLQKGEQRTHSITNAMLVTHVPPGTLEPLLRKALTEIDGSLSLDDIRTMQELVDFAFDQERAVAGLAALFGVVALLLAAVGLYGVTAYAVARRTSEIGIRMTFGANRGSVIQLILRGAFAKVAFGLLLGIPLSIGAGRLLSSQLYGVSNWDPIALSIAMISLAFCAFIAAMIPAVRAASIDPMKALRSE